MERMNEKNMWTKRKKKVREENEERRNERKE
jgi:hypothetical protein